MLLDLPPEILAHILLYLPETSVLACMRVNHFFYDLIFDSVQVQYYLRLFLAGQQDNPHSCLSISERLQKLSVKETRWEELEPSFKRTVNVPHPTSGIYDLTGGIYLLGHASRRALHYTYLPTDPEQDLKWNELKTDQTIIDMGLCVYEHDLIAVITTQQTPFNGNTINIHNSYEIRLLLNLASTGQPHPQAQQPVISVTTMRWERPTVGIEIVGDNLVLVLAHYDNPFKPDDQVFVYEWKTGKLKMKLHAPYHSYAGLLFLTEDMFLLPNTNSGTLEYWSIPKNQSEVPPPQPLLVLSLPKLNAGKSYGQISCRAEPNPTSSLRYSPNPFHPDPHNAIAIFSVNIRTGIFHQIPALQAHIQWSSNFVFFVHRSSLLRCLNKFPPALVSSDDEPTPVPYNVWSPSICRWITAEAFPTRWITTTCGQRCVIIPDMGRDADKEPLILLNFNQADIERILAQEKREKEMKAQEETIRRKAKEMRQKAAESIQRKGTDEWSDALGDQLHDNASAESSVHGEDEDESDQNQTLGDENISSDGGSQTQSGSSTDVSLSLPRIPRARRRGKVTIRLGEALEDDRGCFENIVYSNLPYAVCSSPDKYSFHGVLLDEERILGLRTNALERITTVSVFHYG